MFYVVIHLFFPCLSEKRLTSILILDFCFLFCVLFCQCSCIAHSTNRLHFPLYFALVLCSSHIPSKPLFTNYTVLPLQSVSSSFAWFSHLLSHHQLSLKTVLLPFLPHIHLSFLERSFYPISSRISYNIRLLLIFIPAFFNKPIPSNLVFFMLLP